jgi:general secretion pathway protein D
LGGLGGSTSTNTTTGGGYTFGKTDQIHFSLNLPGVGIKALLSSSDSRVLQSPRVRGFDGYKASLRIGDRIPIATGSFQPGIGGVGINPLVNTQFNYQDVGVNVDLTPRVHAGKEISMHIEIEISNVRSYVDIGGISQPVIGQRKVLHDIRLKEGEGNVIGGLMQTQTSRVVSGVPGLGQIPLLGRLFSNERVEKSENEILIVLVPHIVRMPELTDLNMRGISSGTEQQVKVTFTQAPNHHPPLPPAPPPPAVAAPPAPAPEARPPAAAAPVLVPSNRAENLVPRLRFDRATASEAAGARITLNLLADNVSELFAAPLRIRFDPKVLQLTDARRGVLLSSDGQDVMLSKNIENDRGEASVQVSRFPGSPGVSGSGILLILEFQAAAPGKSAVSVSSEAARNVRLEPVPMEAASAEVVIK